MSDISLFLVTTVAGIGAGAILALVKSALGI